MIKQTKINKTLFLLKAVFDGKTLNQDVIKKKNVITEFISKKEAIIYLGDKTKYDKESLKTLATSLTNLNRTYQLDINTFVTKTIKEEDVIIEIVEKYILKNGEVYTLKADKKKTKTDLLLVGLTKSGKDIFKVTERESKAINFAKSFQMMPNNKLNSVNYADELNKIFTPIKNVSVKVLTLPDIKKLKMGLLLGVNRGSEYDARVVVLEYKGLPSSKEKTVAVGKGIMFDSGGFSLKGGGHMSGMKFDMSGTAILAGAMKLISFNKPKTNFSMVFPLTDNMIDKKAQTVDAVQTSMNGKTVEINNTDAEGRLILADGITYAIRNLKATKIIDVATLTGAVISALGSTYTGTWTTEEKDWELVQKSAKAKNELVWRLPFHKDFIKFMKKSPIADLRNTDETGKGGSSSAAMFLKEFTENIPYIHFDIAGTSEINGVAKGALVKTISEMANG